MSVGGEVSDTLIDSEFSYNSANDPKPGTWSQVAGGKIAGTQSWHTSSERASSTTSNLDARKYGRPGTRSIAGSVHSFNSSIAERSQFSSDHIEMKGNFAKVKAYVSTPQAQLDLPDPASLSTLIGCANRPQKPPPTVDPWVDTDEEESDDNDEDDEDDSDGENTQI